MYDGSLKFDTSIDDSGFSAGIENLGSIASGSMKLIRNLFSIGADAALSFGKSALQTGSEFSSALSQIGATLNFSVSEIQDSSSEAFHTMELLTEKAEELGRTTKYTATEAAEGLNILAMQGFDAAKSMDLISDSLNLASAGNIGIDEAATYIGTAVNGFVKETAALGGTAAASKRYSDMIAKGATLSATSVGELGYAFSQSAATAAAYGQSSAELAVGLLRLAKQSVTGAEAVTALKTVMGRIYAPTQQVKALFDEIGFSAFENGREKDFNQAANELNTALENAFRLDDGSVDKEQYDSALNDIFGMRGLPAFTKMMATAGTETQRFFDELEDAEGSAAKQAEMQLDNLQGRIVIFQSALDGLKNKISKTLESPLREIVDTGTDYISALTEAFLNDGYSGLGETLGDKIGDALNLASGYIPQAAEIGSAFLKSLFRSLSRNSRNYVKAGKMVVKSLADAVISSAPDLSSAGFRILAELADGITENTDQLVTAVLQVADMIVKLLQSPDGKKLAAAAVKLLTAFAQALLKTLPVLLGYVPEIITALSNTISENADEVKASAHDIANSLKTAVGDEIKRQFREKAPELTKHIADAIENAPPAMLAAADAIISALADAFGVSDQWDAFKESISENVGGLDTLKLNLELAFDGIPDTVKTSLAEVSQNLKEDAEKLQEAFTNLRNALFPEDYFSSGQAGEDVNSALTDTIEILAGVASSAARNVTDLLAALTNAAAWVAEHKELFETQPEVETDDSDVEQHTRKIQNLSAAIDGLLTSIGTIAALSAVPVILGKIAGAAGGLLSKINPLVALLGVLAGVSAVFKDVALNSEEWQIGAEEIVGWEKGLAEWYQGLIDAYARAFENDDAWDAAFEDNWTLGIQELTENIKQGWENLKAALDELNPANNLKESTEVIGQDFEALWDDIQKGEQWLEKLGGKIFDIVEKLKSLPGSVKQSGEDFAANWDNFWTDFWSDKLESWSLGMDELIEKFSGWGADLITNFIDGIDSKINPLHDAGTAVGEMLYDLFHHSTPEEGYLKNDDTWMPDMMQNFANGIRQNIPLVSGQAKLLADSLQSVLQNPAEIGEFVMNGFRMPELPEIQNPELVFDTPGLPQLPEISPAQIALELLHLPEQAFTFPELPEFQNPEVILNSDYLPDSITLKIDDSVLQTLRNLPISITQPTGVNPVTQMIQNRYSYHTVNHNQNTQNPEQKPIEMTLYSTVEMDGQAFGTAVKKIILDENTGNGGWFI